MYASCLHEKNMFTNHLVYKYGAFRSMLPFLLSKLDRCLWSTLTVKKQIAEPIPWIYPHPPPRRPAPTSNITCLGSEIPTFMCLPLGSWL